MFFLITILQGSSAPFIGLRFLKFSSILHCNRAVLSNGGYDGAMAWRFFENTPPNSGGVAGFKWQRHGGRHRFNGGGGMVEEAFFSENFPKITDWIVLD